MMAKEDKPQLRRRRRLVGKRPTVNEDTFVRPSRNDLEARCWKALHLHRPRDALIRVVTHQKDLFTEQEKIPPPK